MKPAPFDYARADSVDDALRLLAACGPDARFLAGGQTLGPMLNMRIATPSSLVDIRRIDSLRRIDATASTLTIGACVTHAMLEDRQDDSPVGRLLSHAASTIAFRAVRNRGTVGGSLAHADPAADWPTVMTLLDARLCVRLPGVNRRVAMPQFMLGAFTTVLEGGTLLEAIEIPLLPRSTRWGYCKLNRKAGEFAEALGATLFDPDRQVCRVVAGGLDGAPVVLDVLGEEVLRGGSQAATTGRVRECVRMAAPRLDDFELQMHTVAVRRAILQACAS